MYTFVHVRRALCVSIELHKWECVQGDVTHGAATMDLPTDSHTDEYRGFSIHRHKHGTVNSLHIDGNREIFYFWLSYSGIIAHVFPRSRS